MPTTTYKGLSVQTSGSNPGTWGAGASTALNEGMIEIVDRNLGGIVTKSMASGDVTLSSTEAQNAIVRLTGTLSDNRTLTSPCQGFYFVENLCAASFTVTVTNGVAGVVVPQNTRVTIIADGTNGCRIASQNVNFVGGTKMLFFQTSAPTGWTKDTSLNNGTIRMVSGSVGADGGSADFTSVFTSRTILQANLPNVNFTVTDPGHTHTLTIRDPDSTTIKTGSTNSCADDSNIVGTTSSSTTGISVNSGGSGTAMDFAVKYADAIRAALSN